MTKMAEKIENSPLNLADIKIENPLGISFPVPKSEPNLPSATVFDDRPSKRAAYGGGEERGSISSQQRYPFSVP